MLRTKYRLLNLLTVALIFYVALPIPFAPINRIAVELDINPQDPLFFEAQNNFATFQYHNGTTEKSLTIIVTEVNQGLDWANVSITTDSTYWFQCTLDGLIDNSSERYSIFWLHIGNVQFGGIFSFGAEVGTEFNVTDSIGLIGPQNANYTAIIDRKIVYWATDAPILGAQFSFIVTFFNETDGAVMGQAMYDSTCGMLFTLQGGFPYTQMKLLDTNYAISRNRLTVFPWVLGLYAGVIVVAVVLMKKRWDLENKTITEVTLLLTAGGAAFVVDVYVDVWFYATLGLSGSLYLHIGVMAGFLAICLYQNYNIKCIIPAITEIAFVFSMYTFVGDTYVPHLTAFWGLITSWFIMLYMSKYPQPKQQTKLAKLINEFV